VIYITFKPADSQITQNSPFGLSGTGRANALKAMGCGENKEDYLNDLEGDGQRINRP
jgi:hypothetical protein